MAEFGLEDLEFMKNAIRDKLDYLSYLFNDVSETAKIFTDDVSKRTIAKVRSQYENEINELTKMHTKIKRLIKIKKGTYEPHVYTKIIENDELNELIDSTFRLPDEICE